LRLDYFRTTKTTAVPWDPVSAARDFLQKANAIHPEDADADSYAAQLAVQDLYYECYMASFSKEKLIEFLNTVTEGTIKIPENVHEKKYRAAYSKEAELLLKRISRQE
jgi:hypothetical protein